MVLVVKFTMAPLGKPRTQPIFKIVTDINLDSITPDSGDCQNSNYLYPSAGHVITGNLNVIPDPRVSNSISKGTKFPSKAPFSLSRFKVPVHSGLMIRDEP